MSSMFLKLGNLKGSCGEKGFIDQIVVESWGWGVSGSANLHTRLKDNNQGNAEPSVADLEIVKYLDAASPMLVQAVTESTYFDKATLSICTPADEPKAYCSIILDTVRVVRVEFPNHMGPQPMETIQLHFKAYEFKYQRSGDKGGKAGGEVMTKRTLGAKA